MESIYSPKHAAAGAWIASVAQAVKNPTTTAQLNTFAKEEVKTLRQAQKQLKAGPSALRGQELKRAWAQLHQKLEVMVALKRILGIYAYQLCCGHGIENPEKLGEVLLRFASGNSLPMIWGPLSYRQSWKERFRQSTPTREKTALWFLTENAQWLPPVPGEILGKLPTLEDVIAENKTAEKARKLLALLKKLEAANILTEEELDFLKLLR